MVRLLPIIVLVILFLGALIYLRFFKPVSPVTSVGKITTSSIANPLELRPVPASAPVEDRVKVLEEALTVALKKLGSFDSADTESRLKSLEKTVTDLQVQVGQLQQGGSQTTTLTVTQAPAQSSKSPVYIPLGWAGSSGGMSWTNVTSQTMTIDPADYSGYTSMQFEVSLRVYQGNGTAYARVANKDDGTAVTASEVSTNSGDYTWLSSGKFTLPGKKTYALQLKTLTGYEAGVQNARIRVNF